MNIRFRLRSRKRREHSATMRGRVTIDGNGWVIRESPDERGTVNPCVVNCVVRIESTPRSDRNSSEGTVEA